MEVTKIFEWDAAHRLSLHSGQCRFLHGHRYRAEVTLSGETNLEGMVIDFGELKKVVGGWIDKHWDHNTLVNANDTPLLTFLSDEHKAGRAKPPFSFHGDPTAEEMAQLLFWTAVDLKSKVAGGGKNIRVVQVRIWETPTSCATARKLS